MSDIVLCTLNAKYAHASFGLRYLHANLGLLRDRAEILEFDISQRTVDILEVLLDRQPRILGLGVYIWNVTETTRLVGELKRVRPEITVVLGGPEVSYETEQQEIVRLANYVVTGEADVTFRQVCAALLEGSPLAAEVDASQLTVQPAFDLARDKIIPAALPQFSDLRLPYDLYSATDISHRVIYVEASRGCPFECEFCLSALEIPVRQAALDEFLESMDRLLQRGVRQFKFVDRTFNLNLKVGRAILEFFLDRFTPDLFLHFEMIPDRLPEALRDLIVRFPPGSLQFEVGIQTFNTDVAELISRRQDNAKVAENLNWLRRETGVHVHADLIIGLPGESAESFGQGFDRLVDLRPQEIQVGILKRLRGTPIIRHDAEWGMVYSPAPPYEILQTRLIDYAMLQRLRRFARYWDLVANSGNFVESTPLLWGTGSPYAGFLQFSDWVYQASGRTNGIALKRLAELLFRFLVEQAQADELAVASAIWNDYRRCGRSDRPEFLRPYLSRLEAVPEQAASARSLPPRQARHAAKPG
ncbi:MAG: DUF4080 domain-containing protein [Planctomycetes bacterium]|nr:DUF4080 domain-containing protein [Planctomycetota bacterium]